ncbi:hypothetical protein [Tardiphaga sp.]|uniref:hypothetical protein n=1 Tax=Tardiphaga sp. TaxID=1926292 RepID=UPI002619E101|nr:hypothetical protein [Tardiphaga sp.]MDB5618627.1 hypothetical protein [Tardiphaga sp.]
MRGDVAVSGNVYFPRWGQFSRQPDGYAAPADAVFVAAMLGGLVLYLALATVVAACGMACHALGRSLHALGRSDVDAVSLRRTAV